MQNVTIITNPNAPLTSAVAIMARGNDLLASLSSSAMCVAESGPIRLKIGESIPTRHESPTLPHPPPSVNVKKTSLADCTLGPLTHSGTNTATNPAKCSTNATISTAGNARYNTVFSTMHTVIIAITSNVRCHRSG